MTNTTLGWSDRTITARPTIDLGAFIGRFQFFHNGHLDAILQGLTRVKFLAVLVGSSNQPRTYFNPFSFAERQQMIMSSLPESVRDRVICLPLEDSAYNNTHWILNVQEAVEEARKSFELPRDASIGLVGHKKDGTSFYLNMFPQWAEVAVPNNTGFSATPLREQYFLTNDVFDESFLPAAVIDFLLDFESNNAEEYNKVRDEYLHVQKYKEPYKDLPYPVIFQTVDACVVQSGYVLLIQRKGMPGRGLWAMPGGFLNAHERIEDGIYRELEEETKIDVPEAILRGRTEEIKVFDAVHRSSRGRTITHCALINLQTPPRKSGQRVALPKVKGSDDAKKAKWFPLKGPGAIQRDMMFEDHYEIIMNLTAKL